jgi:hypothetical protein
VEKAIAEAKSAADKKVHELVAAHIDEYKAVELGELLTKYGIKVASPSSSSPALSRWRWEGTRLPALGCCVSTNPDAILPLQAPETGNDLTEPFPFNLMFATSIGPSGNMQGFLRPETAQGIFVNFRCVCELSSARKLHDCRDRWPN